MKLLFEHTRRSKLKKISPQKILNLTIYPEKTTIMYKRIQKINERRKAHGTKNENRKN
jgi:hypothetical protein